MLLHQSRFHTTVNHLADLPKAGLVEVAFAGRSNAGKSSAINVLCNQKRLAFASKTPGRTQHINYFSVGPADEPLGYLVDLPGYGYAQVPETSKRHWEELLTGYLQKHEALAGMILLMDARRPCTELDCRMIDWFAPTGRPIHMLLTKADKLTRSESTQALMATRKYIDAYPVRGNAPQFSAQLFSSLKRIGLDEAHAVVERWLVGAARPGDAG